MLLYGSILAMAYSDKFSFMLMPTISWLSSWLVLTCAYIFLSITGLIISPILVVAFLVAAAALFIIVSRHRLIANLKATFGDRDRLKRLVILYFVCLLFIFLITIKLHYVFATPDSLQYNAFSKIFHYYAHFERGNSRVFVFAHSVRLPFISAVQNFAYLLGIGAYTSFFPVTSFFVIILVLFFLFDKISIREKPAAGLTWFSISALLLLFNRNYLLHSFYYHSNLTVAAYFSAGVFLSLLYLRREEPIYFFFSSGLLASTVLIRKEMLIFSLIPIFLTLYFFKPYRAKIRFSALALFLVIGYPWFLWGIFKLLEWGSFSFKNFSSGHGSFYLPILTLACTFAAFLLPVPKFFRKNSIKLSLVSSALFFLILYFLNGSRLIGSLRDLLSLALAGKGRWQLFWYCFTFATAIYILIIYLKSKPKASLLEHEYKPLCGLKFVLSVIIVFFALRIVLYSIFTAPKANAYLASGNRILLHIFPIAVYFCGCVGYSFSLIASRLSKQQILQSN